MSLFSFSDVLKKNLNHVFLTCLKAVEEYKQLKAVP